VKVITIEDDDYPINLKAIYDPPVVLYIKGNIRKEELCIAMVGTRTPTEYGLLQARHLSKRLANLGFCIVSGLARGIDTACHKAALEENGLTYGVLGCGIDVVYPPENNWLYRRIPESGGGIITEFPFGTRPYKQNFPKRNRIISGLSLGVVVIEAPPKSGALITANLALHQNREVFAVPGPVNSPTSLGVNNLIKEGAKLTSSIEDILQELWFMVKDKLKKEPQLTKAEEEIYNLIKDEPIDIDSLKLLSDKDFGYLSIILLNLELKGLIRQLIGKRFVRV
jgi:DNA processing protein